MMSATKLIQGGEGGILVQHLDPGGQWKQIPPLLVKMYYEKCYVSFDE